MPWTFGFRESFIAAFIGRLRERMREKQAERTTGVNNSMALVRVQRSDKAAADFVASMNVKNAKALSNNVTFNRDGVQRGRAAADAINLDGRAIAKTQTAGRIG
jgi:hypothetical protein